MQHTVHETHILKMISFISSRVNHPGSIRKLSLTIMISWSRSAAATWWLSVEVLTDNLITLFVNPQQTFPTLQLHLCQLTEYQSIISFFQLKILRITPLKLLVHPNSFTKWSKIQMMWNKRDIAVFSHPRVLYSICIQSFIFNCIHSLTQFEGKNAWYVRTWKIDNSTYKSFRHPEDRLSKKLAHYSTVINLLNTYCFQYFNVTHIFVGNLNSYEIIRTQFGVSFLWRLSFLSFFWIKHHKWQFH